MGPPTLTRVAMRRRNLEVKAVDEDPAATLQAALDFGAEDQGVVEQRDTYYHAVRGRLKLREHPPDLPHLIAYARADGDGPRPSLYRIAEVADPRALGATLADSLGVHAVVEKTRRLLLWRNVHIHLDQVAALGDFVELEAAATTADGLEAERPRIERVREALAMEDSRLVTTGYADLVERTRRVRVARPER